MSTDEIDYESLTRESLKGVVREALRITRDEGLPGEHHFYIAFRTDAPGVQVSPKLKGRYPTEMTIVLQHQFWDLVVHEDHFSVRLSFDQVPETLVVPFSAVSAFFDPSVKFGLQFEAQDNDAGDAGEAGEANARVPAVAGDNSDGAPSADAPGDDAEAAEPATGDVVSLDAFRKK